MTRFPGPNREANQVIFNMKNYSEKYKWIHHAVCVPATARSIERAFPFFLLVLSFVLWLFLRILRDSQGSQRKGNLKRTKYYCKINYVKIENFLSLLDSCGWTPIFFFISQKYSSKILILGSLLSKWGGVCHGKTLSYYSSGRKCACIQAFPAFQKATLHHFTFTKDHVGTCFH